MAETLERKWISIERHIMADLEGKMGKILNEPTQLGYELGYCLARFVENAPKQFDRCRTCAFRVGTYANGCETTVMDALKCVMEGVPFNCHEENKLCGGYVSLRAESPSKLQTHWPFSDEIKPGKS